MKEAADSPPVLGSCFSQPNFLDQFCFEAARVRLLYSVPGSHDGAAAHRVGQLRLRAVLREHQHPTVNSERPVVLSWQYSSQGALNDAFLSDLQCAMTCSSAPSAALEVQVVYPTEAEVRESLEGWRGGLSLPLRVQSCHPFINCRLHRWGVYAGASSTAPVGLQLRRHCLPHMKSYAALSADRTHVHWFLMTSANLSQAAWGSIPKRNRERLFVRSYEMGVLFDAECGVDVAATTNSPECSTRTWYTVTPSAAASLALPTASNSGHSLIAVPLSSSCARPHDGTACTACLFLPYDILHPVPYASNAALRQGAVAETLAAASSPVRQRVSAQDVPWVIDIPHSGRDGLGRTMDDTTVAGYSFYGESAWLALVREFFRDASATDDEGITAPSKRPRLA